MNKVLYINANARPDGISRTKKISDSFIEAYKESHPGDEIITLDLYKEGINFLTGEDIEIHKTGPDVEAGKLKDDPITKYARQFVEADKYIVSAPFWNLSFPAILRAYLDYILISGATFKYTSKGLVGLCEGKKAIHIVTRGGKYSEGPMADLEMGDKYLKFLFNFMGIKDYTTFAVENLDRKATDLEEVMTDAIDDAKKIAVGF